MAALDGVNVEMETLARIKKLADVTVRDIKDRYKMGSELGRGRFSVVFDATHIGENESYAVKEVKNESLHDEENLEALETEINILRQLQHPHIVALKEVVATSTYTYIVMELLSGGELFNRIVEKSCFPESEAKSLFAQIMLSMEYLHSLNIVHRDVKPENILYICTGGNDIKLIDFGYAGVWATDKPLTGLCGTPDYVAPEVLTWYEDEDQGTPYGKGSDMWSLGVLLYVILSGCSPFSGDDEEQLLKLVQEAKYEFYENEWQGISAEAKDLIRRLLVVDPGKRLTMEQVIAHPWLREAVDHCRAEMPAKTYQQPSRGQATKKMSRAGSNGSAPPADAPAEKQGPPRQGCACAIL